MKRILFASLQNLNARLYHRGQGTAMSMLAETTRFSSIKSCSEGMHEAVADWLNSDQMNSGGRCRKVLTPS